MKASHMLMTPVHDALPTRKPLPIMSTSTSAAVRPTPSAICTERLATRGTLIFLPGSTSMVLSDMAGLRRRKRFGNHT